MDLANCSLMEITMACVGKVYLEDFSDSIKWTILGLMNRPGSYLESDIGGKLKIYSDEELKAHLLEKIDDLRKQLAEKFPIEDNAEQEAQNNVPDLEDVQSTDGNNGTTTTDERSTTEEDPKNILDEALSVHDSSEDEENENTDEKNKSSDKTFVVETDNESKTDKNKENLDATFTISSNISPSNESPLLPTSSRLRKSRLFNVADWKEDQNDVVESPVLSRLKQNRKRRQLQNDEGHTSSPKGACKRLRLEKISVAEDAASVDDGADEGDKENAAGDSKLPLKTESTSPSRQRSIEQYEKDLDATHFAELVNEEQADTDRPEKQSGPETTVSSSKWTKCDQCSKRVLKEDIHLHIEKMHKMKKRAESVKVALERVTGVENVADQSEEVEVDVPDSGLPEAPSEEPDEDSSLRSEETSDDRSEEPDSSPTKVVLRESDLIKYTKSFEIYITPLTKEVIDKYTDSKEINPSSSSSDSEFDEMAAKIKSKRPQKSPRQKVAKPKAPSSSEDSSDDSDAENLEPIRIRRSIPKPKESSGARKSQGARNIKGRRKESMLKHLQIDMNDTPERKNRIGPRSRVRNSS